MPNNASLATPKKRLPYLLAWVVIALVLIGADQVTKYYFAHHFTFLERVNILPFFDFILVYNNGAAFSFLSAAAGWQRWLFLGLGVVASAFILYLLYKNPGKPLFCTAITLIMAGALGNVIDRIVYSHVIDFLLFYWHDWYFPAFNVADSFITVGAILLILNELINIHLQKKSSKD